MFLVSMTDTFLVSRNILYDWILIALWNDFVFQPEEIFTDLAVDVKGPGGKYKCVAVGA